MGRGGGCVRQRRALSGRVAADRERVWAGGRRLSRAVHVRAHPSALMALGTRSALCAQLPLHPPLCLPWSWAGAQAGGGGGAAGRGQAASCGGGGGAGQGGAEEGSAEAGGAQGGLLTRQGVPGMPAPGGPVCSGACCTACSGEIPAQGKQ